MGQEYQRPGESVLAYANRIRDLQKQILEEKKFQIAGEVSAEYIAELRESTIKCSKNGLDSEIDS